MVIQFTATRTGKASRKKRSEDDKKTACEKIYKPDGMRYHRNRGGKSAVWNKEA
jgi:hypothetical protein